MSLTLIKQCGCFKLVHFSKRSGRWSSVGPEILAFVSHCSANFQQILDYFTPNFKLKYDDSENIKADRVDTIVFNLHQIKHQVLFFWGDIRYIYIYSYIYNRKFSDFFGLCLFVWLK